MDLWASSLMDLRAPPPQVRLLPLRLHAQQAVKKSWSSRLTKTFCSSNRPLNRPDCAAEAPATRGSRGASSADGAPWRSSRSESGGDRSPDRTPWRRVPVSSPDGLGEFQTGTMSSLPRRASSGYFSSDSTPSSPLGPRSLAADRGTQTPSPSGRAVQLAQERMAQERMAQGFGGRAGERAQRRHAVSGGAAHRSSRRPQITAGEMQEEEIGRMLRHIGDEFNGRHLLRRLEDRQRHAALEAERLPPIPQEPIVMLCIIGLLLFLVGRKIYLQGSADGQHHSQV